jgi:tetratricopeptide (TPR) repeat protein
VLSSACGDGISDSARAPGGEPLAVLVDGTGTYSRPISTESAAAQAFFDQGLRLTWGYHFPEASASFREALRHDPDHPMLYWGLALAAGPVPNSRYTGVPDDPQGTAHAAIDRAWELRDTVDGLEQALVRALHVRFDEDTYPVRAERDRAFFETMRGLHERYPDDPDVATLYADSFMILTPWNYWDADGNPLSGTEEVASALERISNINPGHPGANHLYIHLVEASRRPERALEQAQRLETLMPGVGHVVHMPTHTYVRTGDYSKAIELNERSQKADQRFLAQWGEIPFPADTTYPLSAASHAAHAAEFIRYSASVQGNYEKALQAAILTAGLMRQAGEPLTGAAQRAIAHQWYMHKMFADWEGLRAESPVPDGYPYLEGMRLYLEGSMRVGEGDLNQAEARLGELRALAANPGDGETRYRVADAEAILALAAYGLEGEIEEARGNLDAAIDAYTNAVAIEDSNGYMEPPDWPQPMRHYLGAALVEAGRYDEAEAVYRRDMLWNQNNGWALKGLELSLKGQGRIDEAAAAEALFDEAWSNADVVLQRSRL